MQALQGRYWSFLCIHSAQAFLLILCHSRLGETWMEILGQMVEIELLMDISSESDPILFLVRILQSAKWWPIRTLSSDRERLLYKYNVDIFRICTFDVLKDFLLSVENMYKACCYSCIFLGTYEWRSNLLMIWYCQLW